MKEKDKIYYIEKKGFNIFHAAVLSFLAFMGCFVYGCITIVVSFIPILNVWWFEKKFDDEPGESVFQYIFSIKREYVKKENVKMEKW